MLLMLFFLGLFFGSFFLVVIDRFIAKKSFWSGRSICESCQHELAWYDLLPVVSFVLLHGRCGYCHKKFSLSYPLFELLTAVLFVLTYFIAPRHDMGIVFFYLFIASILLLTFFIDLRYQLIPFMFVIPATLISYVYYFFVSPPLLPNLFLSGLGAALFFFALFALTRGKGMGFGDVVYAFFMGSLLGFPRTGLGLYIAFIIGAVVGLLFILTKKKKLRGTVIPFGPFLVIGTYIALFLPDALIQKILSMFIVL